jgi:hypothetical protein
MVYRIGTLLMESTPAVSHGSRADASNCGGTFGPTFEHGGF